MADQAQQQNSGLRTLKNQSRKPNNNLYDNQPSMVRTSNDCRLPYFFFVPASNAGATKEKLNMLPQNNYITLLVNLPPVSLSLSLFLNYKALRLPCLPLKHPPEANDGS